jgi:hypothetical protein
MLRLLFDLIERSMPNPTARKIAVAKLRRLEAAAPPLEAAAPPVDLQHGDDISTSQARSSDRWTSRARPTFLYVMYAMILWALPIGVIAAISPAVAHAIVIGTTSYLAALPEPLYTFFGTGYLGYATLRQFGKVKGTDR